ncbi:HAMP domain-containing histidine kinase [Luteibacter aegosomaticola]|uniref:sensor histidine kinase n=1 Tax=Luteibacter aegosomaticola TaxID=2911538 RepID=UPI001FF890C6|nr:HAMP domain-containing sensor histidine kinase [Luteibacter aegosomaticola]UPG89251.1 HAMP domain-containing histidine kinase [Luteibacter aegosomaticola]
MIASFPPPGRSSPSSARRARKGLLPMVAVALALTGTLGAMHLHAITLEARNVARIQAVRLAGVVQPNAGDDAVRDALSRTLSRSSPTAQVILRRNEGTDLLIDSGRPVHAGKQMHVVVATPLGEIETISDASALRERRLAAMLMMLLLGAGIVAVYLACKRLLERELIEAFDNQDAVKKRVDAALLPRDRSSPHVDESPVHAVDRLVGELRDLRSRHDAALAEAFRQRMQEMARQTRFIEQVGDHFRQPLQALSLFVGGMQPGDDLRQRAVQGQMRTNVTRLNELLDGLLDLARFDAGAIEPTCSDVIAADLFVRERGAIANDAGRLSVDIHWRGGRLPIRSDAGLLGELIHRLVANAVISTPHGRVLVAMRRRGDAVRLEVRDNGMGLEPRQQERLFDDFTRLPGHPGYGLGLAVARRIAELLGGQIGVRSSPGRGTLFWVQLEGAAAGPAPQRAAELSHHPAM